MPRAGRTTYTLGCSGLACLPGRASGSLERILRRCGLDILTRCAREAQHSALPTHRVGMNARHKPDTGATVSAEWSGSDLPANRGFRLGLRLAKPGLGAERRPQSPVRANQHALDR